MQLLADCPMFPSVLLLLAKSLPSSSPPSNESLLAHCSADFYFDATNQILYLSEAKLQHVGHFIAVILQSMALIAAGNQKNRRQFSVLVFTTVMSYVVILFYVKGYNLLWKQHVYIVVVLFLYRIQTPDVYAGSS